MAHFAKLNKNNIVISVEVISNAVVNNLPFPDSEELGVRFLTEWSGGHTNWKQTSYNANFRKNYAGVGYEYNSDKDAFISPSPFNSWILDEDTCTWKAPIPNPQDGKEYYWDESVVNWVLRENE